jgi:hypothetical protein
MYKLDSPARLPVYDMEKVTIRNEHKCVARDAKAHAAEKQRRRQVRDLIFFFKKKTPSLSMVHIYRMFLNAGFAPIRKNTTGLLVSFSRHIFKELDLFCFYQGILPLMLRSYFLILSSLTLQHQTGRYL